MLKSREDMTEEIGSRIQRMRKARGWSARELCRLSGPVITRGTLAKLECGAKKDLSLAQAIGIAHAFGVAVEHLVADDISADVLLAAAEVAQARIRLRVVLDRQC